MDLVSRLPEPLTVTNVALRLKLIQETAGALPAVTTTLHIPRPCAGAKKHCIASPVLFECGHAETLAYSVCVARFPNCNRWANGCADEQMLELPCSDEDSTDEFISCVTQSSSLRQQQQHSPAQPRPPPRAARPAARPSSAAPNPPPRPRRRRRIDRSQTRSTGRRRGSPP